MSSSKSANAVLAKVRAKYGKKLTDKDYSKKNLKEYVKLTDENIGENYDKYNILSQRVFKRDMCNYLNIEYGKCEIKNRNGRYYPLTLTLETKREFKRQYGNDGNSFNGFNVDYETE